MGAKKHAYGGIYSLKYMYKKKKGWKINELNFQDVKNSPLKEGK